MRLCKHVFGQDMSKSDSVNLNDICLLSKIILNLLNTFLTTTMESYLFLVISSLSVVQLCFCCFQTEPTSNFVNIIIIIINSYKQQI